jgi:hypothetical protein
MGTYKIILALTILFAFSNAFGAVQVYKESDSHYSFRSDRPEHKGDHPIVGMDHILLESFAANTINCIKVYKAFSNLFDEAANGFSVGVGNALCVPHSLRQSQVEWSFYIHPENLAELDALKVFLTKHQDEVFFGHKIRFRKIKMYGMSPTVYLTASDKEIYIAHSKKNPLYFDSVYKSAQYFHAGTDPLFSASTPDAFYGYAEKWFDNYVIENIKALMSKSYYVGFKYIPILVFDDGTSSGADFGTHSSRDCKKINNSTCW